METYGHERRSIKRIKAEKLPELLKKFKINIGKNIHTIARTLDISNKGMGLLVPVNAKNIMDFNVSLVTLDQSIICKEEILSVRSLSPNESRLSIMFSKENDLTSQLTKLL